jgi:hypothetical protein
LTLFGTAALLSCQSPAPKSSETGENAPQVDTAWVSLNDFSAWRNYKADTLSPLWVKEEGAIKLTKAGAGDLISRDTFSNFELELEWKISLKGNSGIFYNVVEGDSMPAPYYSAPEMQIVDNTGHPDGAIIKHQAGDNYDMQSCSPNVSKAAGEWNQVRIVAKDGHIEQWFNGTLVVEYQYYSPEWNKQLAASKFKDWPYYGKSLTGHIGLQDHGDMVWFRNLRIRRLI